MRPSVLKLHNVSFYALNCWKNLQRNHNREANTAIINLNYILLWTEFQSLVSSVSPVLWPGTADLRLSIFLPISGFFLIDHEYLYSGLFRCNPLPGSNTTWNFNRTHKKVAIMSNSELKLLGSGTKFKMKKTIRKDRDSNQRGSKPRSIIPKLKAVYYQLH